MGRKFSTQMKEVISYSLEEALRLGSNCISPEHFLLGIIKEGDNTAVRILKGFNVDIDQLQKEIESSPNDNTGSHNSLPLDENAEKVIRGAVQEAKALKSKKVETEHLMLAILNSDNTASQIFHSMRRN